MHKSLQSLLPADEEVSNSYLRMVKVGGVMVFSLCCLFLLVFGLCAVIVLFTVTSNSPTQLIPQIHSQQNHHRSLQGSLMEEANGFDGSNELLHSESRRRLNTVPLPTPLPTPPPTCQPSCQSSCCSCHSCAPTCQPTPPPVRNTSNITDCYNVDVPSDYVFLVDTSGSIGSVRFDIQKNFLIQIVEHVLPVNPGVGVVRFGTNVNTELALLPRQSKSVVETAINDMQYVGGWTRMGSAVNVALNMMQASSRTDKRIFIITDGMPNGSPDPCVFEDQIANTDGLHVIIVGVGGGFSKSAVECLVKKEAVPDDWIIIVDDFDPCLFDEVVPHLKKLMCPIEECCVTVTWGSFGDNNDNPDLEPKIRLKFVPPQNLTCTLDTRIVRSVKPLQKYSFDAQQCWDPSAGLPTKWVISSEESVDNGPWLNRSITSFVQHSVDGMWRTSQLRAYDTGSTDFVRWLLHCRAEGDTTFPPDPDTYDLVLK